MTSAILTGWQQQQNFEVTVAEFPGKAQAAVAEGIGSMAGA